MALIEFGDDFDANKIGTGGLPKAGKCHLLVTEVDEKDGYFSVTHEILAHEDDSQVGKITYNSFQLSGKGSQRAFLFLIAVGLTTREALAEQATGGAAAEIDLADAVGKTYLGTLASPRHAGISILLVEHGPGLIVSRDLPKLGYKGVETTELTFDDCRVPATQMLGPEGTGLYQALSTISRVRQVIAATTRAANPPRAYNAATFGR